MSSFMKISCNSLSIFVVMVLSSIIFPTVLQADINKTTKQSLNVDDYLVQEIEEDQNMDYSVTNIFPEKVSTLAWWLNASTITQVYNTTTTKPNLSFQLMTNISSLTSKQKEELLRNDTLFNQTVFQHALFISGHSNKDPDFNIIAKELTNALQSDPAQSEKTFAPVADNSMKLESTDTTPRPLSLDPGSLPTQESTSEGPSSVMITIRQQPENEQALIMNTTEATMVSKLEPAPRIITEQVVSTTMSPLLVNIKQNMLVLKTGPFSGFVHGLSGILALKQQSHSKELFLAFERVITNNSNTKKYNEALGPDAGGTFKDGAKYLNTIPTQSIQEYAKYLKNLIELRNEVFDNEMLMLINELDQFYNTKEAEDLLYSILPIYEYPGNRTADDVARQLEECVTKPFMNIPNSKLEKKDLIMMLIENELEKRNLLTFRKQCVGLNCGKIYRKIGFPNRGQPNYPLGYKNNNFKANADRIGPGFSRPELKYYMNKRIPTIASNVRKKNYWNNRRVSESQYNYMKYYQGNRNAEYPTKPPFEPNPRYKTKNKIKPSIFLTRPRNFAPNNKQQLNRYTPDNQYYARKTTVKANNNQFQLKKQQASRAMQSRYLTPKYDFNQRKEMIPKLNYRKYDDTKLKDRSYSDHEEDLKFNLQDALRHPHPIVRNDPQHLIGQTQDGRRKRLRNKVISDESSYSDDEGTIKTNIYKVMNNKKYI